MFKFPELSGDILATDDREMEQTSRGAQTCRIGERKASGTVWSMLLVKPVIMGAYNASERALCRQVTHASGKRQETKK